VQHDRLQQEVLVHPVAGLPPEHVGQVLEEAQLEDLLPPDGFPALG
jgi:hypothetical protein